MFFFDLLFYSFPDLLTGSLLGPERPKIDVRLLSRFPNQENKLGIEIENICNILIELESVALVLKKKDNGKLFHQNLNFSKEQLILSPFSPEKIVLIVPDEKNIEGLVKYFEFKLVGKKTRLKVTPINLFSNE